MNESPSPAPVLLRRDRTSGLAIVVGVIVSVAMMSHHPTGSGHAGAAGVAEAAHVAGLNRFVHGALIAASLVLAFGFQGFTAQLARPLARFALLFYVAGTAAMVGAALVNGFVFPAVMERWGGRSDAEIELARVVLDWGWELNQALAYLGIFTWATAVAAWSFVLLRMPADGPWPRIIGAVGLVGAPAFVALFALGSLSADVAGFGAFVFGHSLWNLAVGVLLLRARPGA